MTGFSQAVIALDCWEPMIGNEQLLAGDQEPVLQEKVECLEKRKCS